jgi:hypothetical protein
MRTDNYNCHSSTSNQTHSVIFASVASSPKRLGYAEMYVNWNVLNFCVCTVLGVCCETSRSTQSRFTAGYTTYLDDGLMRENGCNPGHVPGPLHVAFKFQVHIMDWSARASVAACKDCKRFANAGHWIRSRTPPAFQIPRAQHRLEHQQMLLRRRLQTFCYPILSRLILRSFSNALNVHGHLLR